MFKRHIFQFNSSNPLQIAGGKKLKNRRKNCVNRSGKLERVYPGYKYKNVFFKNQNIFIFSESLHSAEKYDSRHDVTNRKILSFSLRRVENN